MPRRLRLPPRSRTARQAGLAAARASGLAGAHAIVSASSAASDSRMPRASSRRVRRARQQAFVDFQNDVTAQGSGARGARRLPLDRARQALHHDRHGDRPGQDLEHERARRRRRSARQARPGGRAHDVPQALHAGHVRHARGPGARRPVRSGAHDADARLGRATRRGVRGCRPWKRARYFPRAGEDMHDAVARECRPCATRSASSTPRRSARSRSSGPTPPNFSTACTSTTSRASRPAAGATAIMLREDGFVIDDGVDRAARAGPLPRDDDDRRRRARART